MSDDGTNNVLISQGAENTPQDTQKTQEPEVVKKPAEVVKKPVEVVRGHAPTLGERDSWLNRNIAPILAIIILFASFGFFAYILNFDFSVESKLKDIVILLIGIVATLVTTVVSYYFGSSHGSSNKSKFIHKLNGK